MMNIIFCRRFLGALAAAIWMGAAGCELDSAGSLVWITPDATSLNQGESVTLTAHGGYYYSWSLANETWGTLNTRTGDQVVYTSLYAPTDGLPASQVVSVSSFYSNNQTSGGSSSTNALTTSTGSVSSASAYITHLPAETSSSSISTNL